MKDLLITVKKMEICLFAAGFMIGENKDKYESDTLTSLLYAVGSPYIVPKYIVNWTIKKINEDNPEWIAKQRVKEENKMKYHDIKEKRKKKEVELKLKRNEYNQKRMQKKINKEEIKIQMIEAEMKDLDNKFNSHYCSEVN